MARPTVSDTFEGMKLDAILKRLDTGAQGLTGDEARRRLDQYGPNALEEKKSNPLRAFLGYFWGPIPWMIEIAAVLSALVRHWTDLAIIGVLLIFNAVVGFYQEYQAGNAIDALKRHLALNARVLRDGIWKQIPAPELVPGDIIRLRLGDVVPADVTLSDGDYLSLDQSSLTGESLPVDKEVGGLAYSGSVVKQGEMSGVVTATGGDTYFGHTASLVAAAKKVSHFQRAVLSIGNYLIYLTLALVGVLVVVLLQRGEPWLAVAQFALILTVAAVPVAMPAVLSVTLAVGAVTLSKMKTVVSRLESIEEMAGIDVLCCDKTGTLTQNRLRLGEPYAVEGVTRAQVVLAAALASREEDADAIDTAVLGGSPAQEARKHYTREHFSPFDPVGKRTEAQITGPDGEPFTVTKGAPQIVLALSEAPDAIKAQMQHKVDELAAGGYRTLAVARRDGDQPWRLLGLLPLHDPPREDAAGTLAEAEKHGVRVKMVTGDNLAIAREIAGKLGMGKRILPAAELSQEDTRAIAPRDAEKIEQADGFAQVYPQHKFHIVRALQARDHIVGMTGDGVNDAPALKQADVGIAVSGATDAARAAADLILTAPGLSVIVRAVEQARKIFERMNSYAVYRITETIRIVVFLVLAMLVYDFYPITAVMIILLALLNDLPIMAIAYDNTWLDPQPVRWEMRRVLTVASVLGGIGVIETFALLAIAKAWLGLPEAQLQSVVFLKLAVAGHLTLFVARTRGPFFAPPYPSPILLTAVVGTQTVAAMIVGFGWYVAPIPWSAIGLIWLYCLVWIVIEDAAKLATYRYGKRVQR